MKRSSTLQRLTRRILSGALSVTVMLSGLLFAAQPASAAGTAKTHYEFVATADANANFAELNPNLTVGAKAGSYSVVRSNRNATIYTEDGAFHIVRLFELLNGVGTRGPDAEGNIVYMTNTEKVNDPDYHYGLTDRAGGGYRTYSSNDLYTKSDNPVYYKVPTVNLELIPQSFRPLDTADIGAANLSMVLGCPLSAGSMNIAFDRGLQVQVSLDGTTWLSQKVGIRAAEFLGGGGNFQLFRFETDNLLDIAGVKGNTIQTIKILPDGSYDWTGANFCINQMQVNTYATAGDFDLLCPEDVIETTQYASGNELRKIVLAEALRVAETQWTTQEQIITISPNGSSAVDSSNIAKYFNPGEKYRAPVYDREADASREQYWSQFIDDAGLTMANHSLSVTLPGDSSATTITVQAPSNAVYSGDDFVWQKEYKNVKDGNDTVQATMNGHHPHGMDCQTFVFNAISRVSRTSAVGAAGTFGATRTRAVGNLAMRSHPRYSDADIIQYSGNSKQKVYEAYAAAQPGDIAVHNLSNEVCNVHTRLVRSVDVVRNSDGTINPGKSKMFFLEQAGGDPAKMKNGEAVSSIGGFLNLYDYISTARSNSSQTFEELAKCSSGGSYVIYTLDEYKDGVVENAKVQAVAASKEPDTTFWNGGLHLSFNSNYRIIRYQVKLVDASGNTLFNFRDYPIGEGLIGVNYTSNELDALLHELPNGSYKIVWEVHSGPLTDYTDTDVPVHSDEIAFDVTGRTNVCPSGHSEFTALSAAGTLGAGSYYLTGDISGKITVPSGVTATLCLNGHNMTGGADASVIEVAGNLTLCSCQETTAYVTGTGNLPAISVNGGTLTMNRGVIVTNKGTVVNGGGVYVPSGTFTMNGGSIIGCTATAGGGVYVENGKMNMTGGLISGNTGNGGIHVRYGGKLTMTGGTVVGGNAVYSLGYVAGKDEAATNISGGFVSSVVVGAADRKVVLSDDVIVSGYISSYGIVIMNGGTVYGEIQALSYQNDKTKVVTPASVLINGGEIRGALREVTEEYELGTAEASNKVSYTGDITVTGGRFSAVVSREELLGFVPEESETMTTMYFVKDCVAPNGEQLYEVGEGLCSAEEEKFMDFQSSLDFGVILHADRNFDPYAFAESGSGYTASAIGQYGTSYGVSFDTTTMPGTLILWAHGIAAKEMHDAITFTVKDRNNKVLFCEAWSVYDVAKLWHGDEDTSDQTMLADMIAYGNEARKAFKYHYNAADELLTLAGATVEEPVWHVSAGSGATNGQQKNVVATLSLRERIELNIYVNDKDATISNVKFGGMYYDESNYTRDAGSGAYTRFTFDNIPVVKAKSKLQFTVTMEDGTAFDMKYSIVDYACLATQDMSNNQRELIIALQKYVDSVYKYFGVTADWVEPDFGNDEIGAVVPPVVKVN